MQSTVKFLSITFSFVLLTQSGVYAASILYLNSTRGSGTANFGDFRSTIADALNNYEDGTVFDVDFIQHHDTGDLASLLKAKPVDFYDQIWFDTTIRDQLVLNNADLNALNIWASNNQPEFILDSSFFFRNRSNSTLTDAASAVTVNQALALQNVGGGIFIGTDHNQFANTANQILENFGFDSFFSGIHIITSNGAFVGDLLLEPETVDDNFFSANLKALSTSNVPIGEHTLNENGGNRTINIYENLHSFSPGKISHIGASFDSGDHLVDIETPDDIIPTPVAGIHAIALSISAWLREKKNKKTKSTN